MFLQGDIKMKKTKGKVDSSELDTHDKSQKGYSLLKNICLVGEFLLIQVLPYAICLGSYISETEKGGMKTRQCRRVCWRGLMNQV